MKDIKFEIVKGSAWMIGLKWFMKGLGVISTLILARLLLPEDFGLVATAMIFVSLLTHLGQFGLDSALIQNQDRSPDLYSTAWTINFLVSVVQGIALYAFAGEIAEYFDDPRLTPLVQLLSVTFLLKGMKNVGVVDFRKDLKFQFEFRLLAYAKIIAFAVTVTVAFLYRSYWALVLGIVAGVVVEFILSYTMHPFRPRLTLARVRELFSFSQWLYLSNMVRFIAFKGPNFVLAKFAGAAQLGIYTIGYELATMPTVELMAPINRALFPGFSKLQNDIALFRSTYLDSSSVLAMVILPAGLGISSLADILIPTAIGVQWVDAIPVVILIGALGAFRGLTANTSSVYLAMGKPKIMVMQSLLWTAMLLPACVVLCQSHGSFGVALAFLVTDLLMLPVRLVIVLKLLDIPFRIWASNVLRPLIGSLLMYLALIGLKASYPQLQFSNSLWHDIFSVLAVAGAGTLIYAVISVALWALAGKPEGAETRTWRMLVSVLRR